MFRIDRNKDCEPDSMSYRSFEAHICQALHECGIIVQHVNNHLPRGRCNNLLGLDIVYDTMMEKNGGIYIETHWKPFPEFPIFSQSVLYKKDGAWLYGIGNLRRFFIFGKKYLQRLISGVDARLFNPTNAERLETTISKGVLIPFDKAEELADRTFHIDITGSPCRDSVGPFRL